MSGAGAKPAWATMIGLAGPVVRAEGPVTYYANGYAKSSADYKALHMEQARDA